MGQHYHGPQAVGLGVSTIRQCQQQGVTEKGSNRGLTWPDPMLAGS